MIYVLETQRERIVNSLQSGGMTEVLWLMQGFRIDLEQQLKRLKSKLLMIVIPQKDYLLLNIEEHQSVK